MPRLALNVAGFVFILVAIAQFTRYALAIQIIANGINIPLGVSLVAGVVLTILAVWMWIAARRA